MQTINYKFLLNMYQIKIHLGIFSSNALVPQSQKFPVQRYGGRGTWINNNFKFPVRRGLYLFGYPKLRVVFFQD